MADWRRCTEGFLAKGGVAMNGTVKSFDPAKGFGFIKPHEGGHDVFVHITAVQIGLSLLALTVLALLYLSTF